MADSENGLKANVMVAVPVEMKVAMENAAKEKNLSLAAWGRVIWARELDFELGDIGTRAPKYATDEERKAAQKKASDERNALVKALLEAYRAGKITV